MLERMDAASVAQTPDLRLRLIVAPNRLFRYAGYDLEVHRVGYRELSRREKRLAKQAAGSARDREPLYAPTRYTGDYLAPAADGGASTPISSVVKAELARASREEGADGYGPVAVWAHASPPCTTFSTNALGTPRPAGGGAHSALAAAHDALVPKLFDELAALAQLERRPLVAPPARSCGR